MCIELPQHHIEYAAIANILRLENHSKVPIPTHPVMQPKWNEVSGSGVSFTSFTHGYGILVECGTIYDIDV